MSASWYEIRVSEPLDERWAQWFEGMEILTENDENLGGGTLLRGCLPDQAALFGILGQIRDLNLTLIEVRRMGP
jgi:hypothetical protein